VVTVNVTSKIDRAALARYIQNEIADRMQRAGGRVRDYAKDEITAAGRVNFGTLRNATQVEVAHVRGTQLSVRVVNDAEHARYNHEGTGVHGPRGAPIVPRRARVLRFRGRSGAFVFTPEVQGITPVPFLTNALDRLTLRDIAD